MKIDIDEKDILWVESVLRKLDFVKWDRYGADVNKNVAVYGWIDRPKDNYKDFIVLDFKTSNPLHIDYISSSARYATKIHKLLYGTTAKLGECLRVEDKFKIKNCIKLCPDDADTTPYDKWCSESKDGYFCSRKRGHKKDKTLKNPEEHHAHASHGECKLVWK